MLFRLLTFVLLPTRYTSPMPPNPLLLPTEPRNWRVSTRRLSGISYIRCTLVEYESNNIFCANEALFSFITNSHISQRPQQLTAVLTLSLGTTVIPPFFIGQDAVPAGFESSPSEVGFPYTHGNWLASSRTTFHEYLTWLSLQIHAPAVLLVDNVSSHHLGINAIPANIHLIRLPPGLGHAYLPINLGWIQRLQDDFEWCAWEHYYLEDHPTRLVCSHLHCHLTDVADSIPLSQVTTRNAMEWIREIWLDLSADTVFALTSWEQSSLVI